MAELSQASVPVPVPELAVLGGRGRGRWRRLALFCRCLVPRSLPFLPPPPPPPLLPVILFLSSSSSSTSSSSIPHAALKAPFVRFLPVAHFSFPTTADRTARSLFHGVHPAPSLFLIVIRSIACLLDLHFCLSTITFFEQQIHPRKDQLTRLRSIRSLPSSSSSFSSVRRSFVVVRFIPLLLGFFLSFTPRDLGLGLSCCLGPASIDRPVIIRSRLFIPSFDWYWY